MVILRFMFILLIWVMAAGNEDAMMRRETIEDKNNHNQQPDNQNQNHPEDFDSSMCMPTCLNLTFKMELVHGKLHWTNHLPNRIFAISVYRRDKYRKLQAMHVNAYSKRYGVWRCILLLDGLSLYLGSVPRCKVST